MIASVEREWNREIYRYLRRGFFLLLVLVIGVGGWAVFTDVSGAVIAPGVIVVDSNVKKVQHPNGGVVGEVFARDGDRVTAGAMLVRLDATILSANLAVFSRGLDELMARRARLEAERDLSSVLVFPPELSERASPGTPVGDIVFGERKLFELRSSARTGQRAQLRQRVNQLNEELLGLQSQIVAKEKETALIHRELDGARSLWDKNLMPITRLMALERETVRVEGQHSQLLASIAQSKGKISEIELQIVQIDHDLASEVSKELREIAAKAGELAERKIAAEDQLRRVDIRAPQSGIVHQSIVHTVGGVIVAGEAIMLVVPASDDLIVEAKVAPQDIDQVKVGQPTFLRFTAFNLGTTPEIIGKVSRISAETTADQRTGANYFTIRISLSATEISRLGNVVLLPGMPVEAFVQTGSRKVLSYLAKPLQDQITRAFRER